MRTEIVRGDLLEIRWVDINEDPSGDPTKADLAHRTSFGLFWEKKMVNSIPCTVTTTTIDLADQEGQNGWCIYPDACILSMKIVRRVRTKKEKEVKKIV